MYIILMHLFCFVPVICSLFIWDFQKLIMALSFPANSAKMGLVETKLAIIPGAGKIVFINLYTI